MKEHFDIHNSGILISHSILEATENSFFFDEFFFSSREARVFLGREIPDKKMSSSYTDKDRCYRIKFII